MASLPADVGMAFILVQHLDPAHESLMVELLAGHTSMPVLQADQGMPIEPNHFYVIPPGKYLSVADGLLQLSRPLAAHGARLPFDFLLNSIAKDYGSRAVAIVLSGTGGDGSLGSKAIKESGGLVIAQAPEEADYDGMPQSAIATGSVDMVLRVGEMAAALTKFGQYAAAVNRTATPTVATGDDGFARIIELVRTRTVHDFTHYKQETLRRRIERRMGMMAVPATDPGRYLELLRGDAPEIELLAKDLLINVTSFFRDRKVFELLAEKTIPALIDAHPPDRPLRVWVVGCSSGEETYSLAMILLEQLAKAKANIKLQIFASDVDPDAVTSAREGLYPDTIASEISATRLTRFFSKEDNGYRVSQELRSLVVFTVQDVLSDPPFSRLDLISCRNLLIYLAHDAQAKVLSLFHFALQSGGILLLGSSETAGDTGDRFEVISKAARLYRHIGRSRPGELDFLIKAGDGPRTLARTNPGQTLTRQAAYAELSRRKVAESVAPASVLISTRYEVLYSLGPLDRYLRLAPGYPSHDLLALAPQRLRTRLRAAIEQARGTGKRLVVAGGRVEHDGISTPFNLDVQPVTDHAEEMVLVCFVDAPPTEDNSSRVLASAELPRVAELERELEATRTELADAVRSLERSGEDQKAINEEALSVNEEYQSTNEELLTSKEELQSLNEELTALNGQLQETLERQRTTSNDLQNVLNSTAVATIFLDTELRIRSFTPATKALFNVIPTDVGRPLSDLNSLTADNVLLADARLVLTSGQPIEREIATEAGRWFVRRVLPYRTADAGIEGVVITFVDISERKRAADALTAAEHKAQLANAAKSRFLAAASHDLRQPLQALTLMRGVLTRKIKGNKTDEA
ncbi:MAG: CheR family methyltransferase, partial [Devosia sp.]